jgi:hypothetical protein
MSGKALYVAGMLLSYAYLYSRRGEVGGPDRLAILVWAVIWPVTIFSSVARTLKLTWR